MFNNIVSLIGSISTIACIVGCVWLFIAKKSRTKNGNIIVINNNTEDKPWKMGTWLAGIFIAGMGVALVCNVPGDLVGYINQGLNPLESIIMCSLLNGIPVWALYSLLGYWYIKHMDSKIGKVAAMLSTVFGMAISIWTGTNAIMRMLGVTVPGLGMIIAGVMVGIAFCSARFNWLKSVSRVASFLFFICALTVIQTPIDTVTIREVSGGITPNFWKEYFLGATASSWWFWWISWAPTVARWLAHISNGKTVRQYFAGTLLLPSVVCTIWVLLSWIYQDVITSLSIFGNTSSIIPAVLFIITGIMFMIGTLDSDCKVFTEDLSDLTKGVISQRAAMPWYSIFVLALFCLFISGIISNPWQFNSYTSLVFIPLFIWAICTAIKDCTVRRKLVDQNGIKQL